MMAIKRTALILLLIFGYHNVQAYQVEPMAADFAPLGQNAQKIYRIKNNSDRAVALQLQVATREQNLDGTEKREIVEEDFMIYPAQVVVKPHSIQKVRVQWIGDTAPYKELAYRFIAEQVPVSLSKDEKLGVKMALTVMGTIYIVPPSVNSDIVVDSIAPYTDENGKHLALTVTNRGTAHGFLTELELMVTSGNQQLTLSGEQVKGAVKMNILSGATRRLLLPWPQELEETKEMSAEIKFKPAR